MNIVENDELSEENKYDHINKDSKVYELDFSMRIVKCLMKSRICTVEDLYDWLDNEGDGKASFKYFKKIRNFGKKSLDEMIDKLILIGILKKNEEGELELQPDRLYPEKHSLSEVGDAVSDLNESQVYGTLEEINKTVEKENSEQSIERNLNEEN